VAAVNFDHSLPLAVPAQVNRMTLSWSQSIVLIGGPISKTLTKLGKREEAQKSTAFR
jgi:hypothetical protein